MKKGIVIVGLCVAVVGGGVAAWRVQGASPTPQTQPPAPAVPVVAEKVQVSGVPLVRSGIGTVMPYNVVDIHTQVTGTIDKIGFLEGQTVHPGSLIAQLDPRPFQAALQQAESNLARDQAHLTNAQTNLGRFVPLAKQGYATERFKSFRGAQPPRKLRWTNAGVFGVDEALWRFQSGRLMPGPRITVQGVPPEEPEQDIAAQGEVFVRSSASPGAKFGVLVAMATAEPFGVPRRAATRPGSGRGGRVRIMVPWPAVG